MSWLGASVNNLRKKILSEFSSILPSELNRIISTAPHRYKVFYIPKKTPGEYREIAQPASEIKILQNWLVGYISNHLPIHDCVMAYKAGTGIRKNAEQHQNNRYVLKMDFERFFPSIGLKDVVKHFINYGGNEFSEDDVKDICKIILWSPPNDFSRHLCIGAPSSPFISNSILFDFDEAINRFCKEIDVIYTRYADDLIFSTNREQILSEVEKFVYQSLRVLPYPKLSVNTKKTIHTSKGRGISITGVVVTPAKMLSVGRDRKRSIRASIHHFLNQKLSLEEVQKLNGLLAFTQDIEPRFVDAMKAKYGADILNKIKNYLSTNE
jgi:RNA-directed DNA polymerase